MTSLVGTTHAPVVFGGLHLSCLNVMRNSIVRLAHLRMALVVLLIFTLIRNSAIGCLIVSCLICLLVLFITSRVSLVGHCAVLAVAAELARLALIKLVSLFGYTALRASFCFHKLTIRKTIHLYKGNSYDIL
jgi:hypothetical protein